MFGHMFNVIAWGVGLSLLAIAFALLAEGRGSHALRVLLGTNARKEGLDVFSTIARDEGDWHLLGTLSDLDRVTTRRAELESVGSKHS